MWRHSATLKSAFYACFKEWKLKIHRLGLMMTLRAQSVCALPCKIVCERMVRLSIMAVFAAL